MNYLPLFALETWILLIIFIGLFVMQVLLPYYYGQLKKVKKIH